MNDSSAANTQNQTFTNTSLEGTQLGQGTNVQQQKIDGNVGGNVLSAKKIEFKKKINNFISKSDKSFKISKFSIDDTIPLQAEIINCVEQTFIYPMNRLEDLSSCLMQYRMLLLTGEPGTGKNFTAIFLAHHIIKETTKNYEIRWHDLYLKGMDDDPIRMAKNTKNLNGKIVIFKDAFSTPKNVLMDFFRSCSREQIAHICNNLEERDSFFIFTADSHTFDQYLLSNLTIKREICSLDQDLLSKGFEFKLKHFCDLSPKRDYIKVAQLLENKKQEIILKMRQLSKIAHFIEDYLDKILFDGKSIDEALEEVLDSKKRLEHLFLEELGANKTEFEAWAFALCLSLFNGISYANFHEIHREVTMLLLRRLDPYRTFKEFTFTATEGNFIEKCGAHIIKDTGEHFYRIEFRNQEDQKILLNILMQNYQKILLEIIPFLEKYVETHFRSKQRRSAAVNIGRIGVLDPESIIFRIIDKWTILAMQDDFHWENVGFIYEGIMTSDDKDYKKYCLNKLNIMAFSDDIEDQWTAIAAYKHIGLHDLEFALDELRKIQEEAIARMDSRQNENILDFIYSQDSDSNPHDLLEKMDQIYNETIYLISYVRYSIVALSSSAISEPIAINPIELLHELRKWVHKGNQNSRGNTAIFFLGPSGILEELENIEVIYSDEEDKDKKEKLRTNLLLYSLASNEESISKLADFINDIYKKSFPEFHLEIEKDLKKKLFEHMEKWTVESLYNDRVSDALKNLFSQIYQTGDEKMKDSLWDSFSHWKVPNKIDNKKFKDNNERIMKEKEEKLNNFIDELKNRTMNLIWK